MKPEEIKEIRTTLRVTQEKFAALVGTTVTTINRWENGKAKPSRLYVRELKDLKKNYGSYLHRTKQSENT